MTNPLKACPWCKNIPIMVSPRLCRCSDHRCELANYTFDIKFWNARITPEIDREKLAKIICRVCFSEEWDRWSNNAKESWLKKSDEIPLGGNRQFVQQAKKGSKNER